MITIRHLARIVLLTSICGLAAHSAMADLIQIKDGTLDTGWSVDNPGGTGFFSHNPSYDPTADSGAATNEGTLTLNEVFGKGITELKLVFTESKAEQGLDPATKRAFGLRITLNQVMTNKSGTDWISFKETLDQGKVPVLQGTDKTKPNFYDLVSGAHPGFVHFHNDPSQAFPVTKGAFTRLNDPDAEKVLMLGKNTFKTGTGPFTWTGIGIHQFELKDQDRSFTLIKTAGTPEPAALFLLGIGSLGLLVYAWRARGA
jgi:hypothetical protein